MICTIIDIRGDYALKNSAVGFNLLKLNLYIILII